MLLRLLRKLAEGPLPMVLHSGEEEIAALHDLEHSGWIKATFHHCTDPGCGEIATVTEITHPGRVAPPARN